MAFIKAMSGESQNKIECSVLYILPCIKNNSFYYLVSKFIENQAQCWILLIHYCYLHNYPAAQGSLPFYHVISILFMMSNPSLQKSFRGHKATSHLIVSYQLSWQQFSNSTTASSVFILSCVHLSLGMQAKTFAAKLSNVFCVGVALTLFLLPLH